MECRKLMITIVSADNLPNVRNFGQMKVYAEVSLEGKPQTTRKCQADLQGRTNPKWNFPVEYTINELTVHQPGIKLSVTLRCQRTFGDNKYIGEVSIPVKSLFDMGLRSDTIISYTVAGTGKLNIMYSFSGKVLVERVSGPNPAGAGAGATPGWVRGLGVIRTLVLVGGVAYDLMNGESNGGEEGTETDAGATNDINGETVVVDSGEDTAGTYYDDQTDVIC